MARAVAQKMSEGLGQQVVIDNRPGASTIIGAEAVAKSAADGYTLLFATGTTLNLNPLLFAKLPYNPEKDFVPVGKIAVMPYVLLVHPSMPNSFESFVSYAKANPGKLNFGTPGKNTSPHLAGVLFEQSFGLRFESIHYKGMAPVAVDMLAGRLQVYFDALITPLSNIKSGKLRALGVASLKRLPAMPDLPAIAEFSPGFDVAVWYCVVAPTGTPQEIVKRLNAEIQKYVNDPASQERMFAQGVFLEGGTPEQLAAYIREETRRWTSVIKKAGLKPE
ncbi:MAG: tripartite tricarboxylate transporter substrate binding protein [Betaproteobacteria bacterium]|nr:tripartite tricarboxylate transporter substrate binding protein [Betaproteobacteria bacterium]